MTEERMIRVNFSPGNRLVLNVLPNTIRYEDTEPAPPKDWRPACFYPSYPDKDKCVQYLIKKNPELPNACINCPYRLMDEK